MTQIHQKLNNKYLGRETTKKKKKAGKELVARSL